MREPTVVNGIDWVAALRPDGRHMTFEEAITAIRLHGHQFDAAELELAEMVQLPDGKFRFADDGEEGLFAWVLNT